MAISYRVDQISFELGMINSFIEMVACGVKKLAISPPIEPQNLELLVQASKEISEGFGTRYYVEQSLLITDIQSAEFTKGKNSILYYAKEQYIQEYLLLKKRVEELEAMGCYIGAERRAISVAFGKLLSYPDDIIFKRVDSVERINPFVLQSKDK